jgi:hypothetical protein
MARTVQQIKQSMIDAKNADANLAGLTSTSQTAKWNLYYFIVASCIAIFEQLQDLFKVDLETIAASSAPSTPQWTRNKVLQFQYDATTPQVAELNTTTFVIEYPVIDPSLQILTRCAVVTAPNRTALIKVAKNDPPEPISGGELSALDTYIDTFNPAGIAYIIINEDSDKMEVVADIYYNGQYASVISTNVVGALNNYMANLPFNGRITTQAVVDAIQSAEGVITASVSRILVRRDTVAYGAGVTLFNLATGVDSVNYDTYAGYVTEETAATHTFADTLTYIVV